MRLEISSLKTKKSKDDFWLLLPLFGVHLMIRSTITAIGFIQFYSACVLRITEIGTYFVPENASYEDRYVIFKEFYVIYTEFYATFSVYYVIYTVFCWLYF